ncbi:DUF1289 domain-containing protein [Jannaschia ovalis]|uniref:DUF1289 domain-containing protein n=1 Tax=Jannaschia ovalis TaxID=3038773 RepID=A0ABY8LGE5_9RHOB|nr:DUF1289 domain-containing protein [Jannaschia sp. GRR-S6-38]WGH79425.1 DUF1289 domain-containing protein [Jannaschia sp. GRR-S6-38]
MSKIPSPCIDVCKYRRAGPEGARHCIACSLTKPQKKAFKPVKAPAARAALVRLIARQQAAMGGFGHWRAAYLKRCAKKGVTPPV